MPTTVLVRRKPPTISAKRGTKRALGSPCVHGEASIEYEKGKEFQRTSPATDRFRQLAFPYQGDGYALLRQVHSGTQAWDMAVSLFEGLPSESSQAMALRHQCYFLSKPIGFNGKHSGNLAWRGALATVALHMKTNMCEWKGWQA